MKQDNTLVSTMEKPAVVLPLLAMAVMMNFFLFSVAYTNASFNGAERSLPSLPQTQISQLVNDKVNIIADNLNWTVSTALAEVQPQVVAFMGLQDYRYGMPRYSAVNSSSSVAEYALPVHSDRGAVLGASLENLDSTQ
ncbi:MAG: hypothetical protein NVSMB66_5670 [Candidatus Doudnabacteria bacterium]